jgi:thioesterase domain-containing protein/acyl carrier protein
MVGQLAEALGLRPEQIDTRRALTSYGLDSLRAFELTGDLAYRLDYEVPVTLFWDYPTIEALSQFLSEQLAGRGSDAGVNDRGMGTSEGAEALLPREIPVPFSEDHSRDAKKGRRPLLFTLRRSGSSPPMYAVPGLYGHVLVYADLSRELGPEQPFYALQSVGLDGAEAPLDSIAEMAKLYVNEIRKFQPHGPYTFIGACFGATVAYEMARQVLAADQEVAFLGLVDPTQREGIDTDGDPLPPPRAISRAKALGWFFRARLRLYFDELRPLDTAARIKYSIHKVLDLLRSKNGIRNAFKDTRREIRQIQVIQANIRALDRYQRKPLIGCLGAMEIFESSHARNSVGDSLDWKTLWDGQVIVHLVPGKDSGDMLHGKNARILARLLGDRVRAAMERNAPRGLRTIAIKIG